MLAICTADRRGTAAAGAVKAAAAGPASVKAAIDMG